VADGDLVFQKCLGDGRYEVSESDTTVDIRLALASARSDDGDGVGRLSEFKSDLKPRASSSG
jgi:hypothetical protein